MALSQEITNYTVDDIYKLPDGKRAELIDGQIYMLSAPGRQHQELVHFLDMVIGNYIHSKDGSCKVYPAPFAVFLNPGNKNYVEPDISVICNKNLLTDKGCNGAPDWIIEIVSPSSQYMDYLLKLSKYQNSGVREYWIADYPKNRITVYNFENSYMQEYSFSDIIKAGIYEDLEIDFSQINF